MSSRLLLVIMSPSLSWVGVPCEFSIHVILYIQQFSLSTALPAPVVTISPASGSPTVGQTYSLTCSVQVVPHLVVEPSIEWTRQDGTVVNTSSGYSLQLNFNPLQTSDSNHYTCRASITITGDISVSGENSSDVVLTSELRNNLYLQNRTFLWCTNLIFSSIRFS